MTLSRRTRLLTVIFSLWALLWGQLALAAYMCPSDDARAELVQMVQAGLPCVDSMTATIDPDQPILCHAHCQATPVNTDLHPASLAAPLPQPTEGLVVAPAIEPPEPDLRQPTWLLRRAAAPPLTIRHCCWRI
jgi:hypothetical protein